VNRGEDVNARKLIDRLVSDERWGPMIGLVATTYEMQPDFLEMDFLPSLFRLGAWDDRSWSTRIGMERKLAELEVASIFMDSRCYRGRPRSLRLELLPVTTPRGTALHAKVSLLLFEKAVRVIVGSANLTEPGFRKNREVIAVFTATESSKQESAIINQALTGMETLMAPWLTSEARNILLRAQAMLKEWSAEVRDEQTTFQWSGGATRLWQEFLSRWPADDLVRQATIVSPFWSADAGTTLHTFISELRNRRLLDPRCEVHLLTEAFVDPEQKYLPVLPEAYAACDWSGFEIKISAQAVNPSVLREEVGDMEGFTGSRRLHAKVVLMQGARNSLAYLGSANFTAHGWGFLGNGAMANIEAGLILRRSAKNEGLQAILPGTVGEPVELASAKAADLRSPEGQGESPPWPEFLKRAVLVPKDATGDRLQLEIEVESDSTNQEWSARLPDKEDLPSEILLSKEQTQAATSTVFEIALTGAVLNRLLLEQELVVLWRACPAGRAIPLNVSRQARDRLPISPGCHKVEERNLLSYYQGKIAWEDLFPDPEVPPASGNSTAVIAANASSVDKTRIQSYQIREFVEALTGLGEDLKAATQSEPSMRLALLGPVSPVALARTIMEAVNSQRRTATAAGFQLTEILASLQSAKRFGVRERLAAQWLEYVDQATAQVKALLDGLVTAHADLFTGNGAFNRYSRAVLGRREAG